MMATHEFRQWFPSFINELKAGGGAWKRFCKMVQLQQGFNPYFVAFAAYWYTFPGRDRAQLHREVARERLREFRRARRRLLLAASDVRQIAGHTYKPPLGDELREIVSQCDGLRGYSADALHHFSGSAEQLAGALSMAASLIKDEVSLRRRPRVAHLIYLIAHVQKTGGLMDPWAFISLLLDAAHTAFGSLSIETRQQLREACKRYGRRFPVTSARYRAKGESNSCDLTAEEINAWTRLDGQDIGELAESMMPHVARELVLTRPASVSAATRN